MVGDFELGESVIGLWVGVEDGWAVTGEFVVGELVGEVVGDLDEGDRVEGEVLGDVLGEPLGLELGLCVCMFESQNQCEVCLFCVCSTCVVLLSVLLMLIDLDEGWFEGVKVGAAVTGLHVAGDVLGQEVGESVVGCEVAGDFEGLEVGEAELGDTEGLACCCCAEKEE